MGELTSSREGRKRIKNENSIRKARRDKEAEMDKAGKKDREHAQVEYNGARDCRFTKT